MIEGIYSWFRVVLTWIVIIPDIFVSYIYLRNPTPSLEIVSLVLNFLAATILFYIYMDISKENNKSSDKEEEKDSSKETPKGSPALALYKLTFGALIEDMIVWFSLFFLLYNILPITLYVHNIILKGL